MPRFVSGHDFSRAADRAKSWGFRGCGKKVIRANTESAGAKAQHIFSCLRHD
jgi:hypothetical protein